MVSGGNDYSMASQRAPAASDGASYDVASARSPQAAKAEAAPTYDLGRAEPSAPASGGDVGSWRKGM